MKTYTIYYQTYLTRRQTTMRSGHRPRPSEVIRFLEARHGHAGATQVLRVESVE